MLKRIAQILGGVLALGLIAYGSYVFLAWFGYGRIHSAVWSDPLADRLMPSYEVREQHQIEVAAPSAVAMESAKSIRLEDSLLIRTIFKAREIVLGSHSQTGVPPPKELVAFMRSIGWRVLADVPGREMVFGGATQPWKADVVFRGLPPSDFAAFREPDYVKILWTIRADPAGDSHSILRTETRVMTTDAESRSKFRRYWATFSPGILLIRQAILPEVKADAERRFRSSLR